MTQPVKPAPLGRGLSALFGDADASYRAEPRIRVLEPASPFVPDAPATTSPPRAFEPMLVMITRLQPGVYQPRRHFDEEALKGLAGSIKESGILEPLIVRPVVGKKDFFEIVAGERRWRAAQLAGLHHVPVVVRNLTDRQALEFGIIENVQRQDLSPLEEAEGYKRLQQDFGHTLDKLAEIVGKSRPHISNMIRILSLPPAVREMIEGGEISMGHARALITSKEPMALAVIIARKGLNVRQAEALAQRRIEIPAEDDAKPDPEKLKLRAAAEAAVAAYEKDLSRILGYKIKITQQAQGGFITIHYKDIDQFGEIIKRMKGEAAEKPGQSPCCGEEPS